jgi:dihydrofolate reductase
MSVSVDGFMEGPNHDISWHLVDEELHSYFNDSLRGSGAFLSGRVTYELMAEYWPTADADPESPPPIVEFAQIWRETPKVVYSTTLEHAEWNTTIVRDVVPDDIDTMKAQPGGDLILGGANVATTFLRHNLIDEIRVYVHPVVIGEGTRMFQARDVHRSLRLAETRTFGNGVVLLRYEHV